MKYWLIPIAEQELKEAVNYYAKKASILVAKAFLADFKAAIQIVAQNPHIGTLTQADLRIYPLRRFPYSIIYQQTDAGPIVYALANQYRRPMYWQKRLQ